MQPIVHFTATGLMSGAFKGSWKRSDHFAFVLSSAFLDVDHYLAYLYRFGSPNLLSAVQYFEAEKNRPKICLCVFHTLEFLGVLFIGMISFPQRIWRFLFFGAIFHLFIDIFQGVWQNRMHYRWWSVIQYLVDNDRQ